MYGCSKMKKMELAANTNIRDVRLDILKGFLVIGMVLFHVGTFSIASSHLKHLAIGVLLNFVSGSWVFLAGYVIGFHYGPRYGAGKADVALRLVSRGLKILLLFFVINTLILYVGLSKSLWSLSFKHVATVLLVGGGDLSSFEILVGIGLLLIISPMLLEVFLRFKLLSLACLFAFAVPGSFGVEYSPNIWMLICGACGIWIGLAFKGRTDLAVYRKRWGVIVLVILLAGLISHFWLFYFGATRKDILIYLLGVVTVNGFILIFLSRYIMMIKMISNYMQLLGRYSLISYLWQMNIIWCLIYLSLYLKITPEYFRDVMVVLVLLIGSILVVDYTRRKLSWFDSLYRFIFV